MDFAFDRSPDLSRQVRNALEDEAAQPLREVQRHAPEGCDYFSELEASLGEWSFGYGVAWALARAGDPMMSSSRRGAHRGGRGVRGMEPLQQQPAMDGADGRGPRASAGRSTVR